MIPTKHRLDTNILYVRKAVQTGRDQGDIAVFGYFSSMEAAKRAEIVRWHVKMDNEVRDGLVRFLEEASKALKPRTSNKRRSIDISPDEPLTIRMHADWSDDHGDWTARYKGW